MWAATAALYALVGAACGQVVNLQFDDTDVAVGDVGGEVLFDQPAAGPSGISSYAVYFATDAVGTAKSQVGNDVAVGSFTSSLVIASGTAIGANTHLLVYPKDSAGSLMTLAAICLLDNSYARTVYIPTTGHTKALGAKTALSDLAKCHANANRITIEMVATAKWDGTSAVTETVFDNADEQSSTAAFLVTFTSSSAFATIVTDTSSYVDDAPVPAFYTGTGADTTISLGTVPVQSDAGTGFAPMRPDTDLGRYLAKYSIDFSVAYAGIVTRLGQVFLLTLANKQGALQEVSTIYDSATISFVDLGAESATVTAIGNRATQTQAQCWQVTGTSGHASCTGAF